MATPEDIRIQEELLRLERERAGITQDNLEKQQNISNYLQQQLNLLRFEKAEKTEIRSITRQLNKIAAEGAAITLDELGSVKSLSKIQKDRVKIDQSLTRLLSQRNAFANREGDANKLIVEALDDQIDQLLEINAELEQAEINSKKIADNLGVKGFQVAEDIISAIPGLRQFKGSFIDATNAARKAAIEGGSSFTAGAKSLMKSAKAALPLLVFTQVLKAFTQLDTSSGNIAKNLGISYNTALGINKEFTQIATTSDNIFVTTQNLSEAFVSINNALGTNATLNEDLLITQTELVKQAGYSVEAATQLATLSLATGQSSKGITTEFLGQVKALNIQNDLALNEKTLLESIAKTSKGTLATFAAQPQELARAAFEARRLGLELSKVEEISDALLDIESSLTAEFEAEVISGRQLFLERARFFALTNDLAGVAKELAAQDITRASFAKANRIEQDAIAASLGMSRDQLGEMLLEQEAITKLTGIEGATAKERFNNLVKEVGLEEAKKRLGDETLANQLASVTTQERFAQILSRFQELFVQIATPLMPMLSGLASFISKIAPILPTIGAIAGFLTGNPFLIAASTAAIFGQIQSVGDGIAPSSKGPFTITDSYGGLAVTSKGDSLAVSPNIRRDDRNTGTTLDYDKLAEAIAKGAERGTSRATVATYLDGDKVSTRLQPSLAVNTRRYSV